MRLPMSSLLQCTNQGLPATEAGLFWLLFHESFRKRKSAPMQLMLLMLMLLLAEGVLSTAAQDIPGPSSFSDSQSAGETSAGQSRNVIKSSQPAESTILNPSFTFHSEMFLSTMTRSYEDIESTPSLLSSDGDRFSSSNSVMQQPSPSSFLPVPTKSSAVFTSLSNITSITSTFDDMVTPTIGSYGPFSLNTQKNPSQSSIAASDVHPTDQYFNISSLIATPSSLVEAFMLSSNQEEGHLSSSHVHHPQSQTTSFFSSPSSFFSGMTQSLPPQVSGTHPGLISSVILSSSLEKTQTGDIVTQKVTSSILHFLTSDNFSSSSTSILSASLGEIFTHSFSVMVSDSSTFDDITSEVRQQASGPLTVSTIAVDVPFSTLPASERTGFEMSQLISPSSGQVTFDGSDFLSTSEVILKTSPSFDRNDGDLGSTSQSVSARTLSGSLSFNRSDIDLTSLSASTNQEDLKTSFSSDVQLTSAFSDTSQLPFSKSVSLNSKRSDDNLTVVFNSTSIVPLKPVPSLDRNTVNVTSIFPSTPEVDESDVQVSSHFDLTLFPSHSEVTLNTVRTSNRSDIHLSSNFTYSSQEMLNTFFPVVRSDIQFTSISASTSQQTLNVLSSYFDRSDFSYTNQETLIMSHSIDRSDVQFTSRAPSTSQQTSKPFSSFYDRGDFRSVTLSSPNSSMSFDNVKTSSFFSGRSDSVIPISSSTADLTTVPSSSSLTLLQSKGVVSFSEIVPSTDSPVYFSDTSTNASSLSIGGSNDHFNYTSSEGQSMGSDKKSTAQSSIGRDHTSMSEFNIEKTLEHFFSPHSGTLDGSSALLSTATDFMSLSSSVLSILERKGSTQIVTLSTINVITSNSPVSSLDFFSSTLHPSFQITELIAQSGSLAILSTETTLTLSPSYNSKSDGVHSSLSFSFPTTYNDHSETSPSSSFSSIGVSSIPVLLSPTSDEMPARVTTVINPSFSSDTAVNSLEISSNAQDLPISSHSAIESIPSTINKTLSLSNTNPLISSSIVDTQGQSTTLLESYYITSEPFLSTHSIFSTDMSSLYELSSSDRLFSLSDSFTSATETYPSRGKISMTLILTGNTAVSFVERTTSYEGSTEAVWYTSSFSSRSDSLFPQSSDYRTTQTYFSSTLSSEASSFPPELIASSVDTSGLLKNSLTTPYNQAEVTTNFDDLTVAIETNLSGTLGIISSTPAISNEVIRPSIVESNLILEPSDDKTQSVLSSSLYSPSSPTSGLKETVEGTTLFSTTHLSYEASSPFFTEVSFRPSSYKYSTTVDILPSQNSNISILSVSNLFVMSSASRQSSQISFEVNSTNRLTEIDSIQTLYESHTDFQHSLSPSKIRSSATPLHSQFTIEDSVPSTVVQTLQPTVTVEYTSQRSNDAGSAEMDLSLISEKSSEDFNTITYHSLLSSKTDSVITQTSATSSTSKSPLLVLSSIQSSQLFSDETAETTITISRSLDISFTLDSSFGDSTVPDSTMLSQTFGSSQMSAVLSKDYRNSSMLSIDDVLIPSSFVSSFPSHSSFETNISLINTDLMTPFVDQSFQTFSLMADFASSGLYVSTSPLSSADKILTMSTSLATFESTLSIKSESSAYEEISSSANDQVTVTLETIPIAWTSDEIFSDVGEISSQSVFPITYSTVFYNSSESKYISVLYSDLVTSSSILGTGKVTVLSDMLFSQSSFLWTSSYFPHTETILSDANFVTLESRSDYPPTITFSSYPPFLMSSDIQEPTELKTLTAAPSTHTTSVLFSSLAGFNPASSMTVNTQISPSSSEEPISQYVSQTIEPSSLQAFSPIITHTSSSVMKVTSEIFAFSFPFSSQSPKNTNSAETPASLNKGQTSISQTDISSFTIPPSSESYTSLFPSTDAAGISSEIAEISSQISSSDTLLSSNRPEITSISLEKTALSSLNVESVLYESHTTLIESSISFSSSSLPNFGVSSVILTSPPPDNTDVDVSITPVVSSTFTSSLVSDSPLLTGSRSEIDLNSSTVSSYYLPVLSSQSQDLSFAFSTIVSPSPFSLENSKDSLSSYLSFTSASSEATLVSISSSLGSQVVDFSSYLDASLSTTPGSSSVVSLSLTPSRTYSDFTSESTGPSSLGVTTENVTETMSTRITSSLDQSNASSLSLSITPTLTLTSSTQEIDVSEESLLSELTLPSLRLSSVEDFTTSSIQVTSAFSVPVSIYPSMSDEESTTSIPIDIGSSTLLSLVESSSMSSVSSSLLVSSFPPSQLPSSSIQPSPTSSALSSSSRSISTLPPVTVPTIDNNGNQTQYWVSLGLLVRQSVNVSTIIFKTQVEQGLANAYAVAKQRQQELNAGSFEPLQRRKRLATAENDPSIQVEVTSISREGSTSQVNVAHVVQQNGQLATAADAVDQLSLLADQELAIELGIVVGSSARPYIVQPVPDDSDDNLTWIIVGSGLGAAAVIIAIIIVCCCCCCGKERQCCQLATETETKISDISNTHFVNEIDGVNHGYVNDEPQGKSSRSLVRPSKKGKYSIQQQEEDPLYASIEHRSPVKAGKKKKSSPQKSATPQSSVESDQEVEESNGPGKKKKSKKPKMEETDEAMEMRSIYESQIASLQNNPTLQTEHYAGTDFSATGQPTIEIERDLLDNADEERKKNKQRLRERKMKEKEQESPTKVSSDSTALAYENAQKEIDKVLGPRIKVEEETKMEKKSSKSKHRDKERNKDKGKKDENNEKDEKADERSNSTHPPETLEEAKQRMHKLLDDAFSLFSQSRSSIGNKVHPSPRESSDEKSSPTSQRSHASHSSKDSAKELEEPQPEEKKHTPIIVQRSHGPYDNSGLISWSPYRASDETALISLPTSQTNLDAVPPQREVITTSTFSENLPTSLRPNYYTTLPGEPIVIKMQDLEQKSSTNPEENPREEQTEHREPPPDAYSELYYGMSSYQEIPQESLVPNSDFTALRSASSHLSPGVQGVNYIDVRMHSAPGRGENHNNDELDVIKQSVQPGASPEPLINSLREELMSLSLRKKVSSTDASNEANSSKN